MDRDGRSGWFDFLSTESTRLVSFVHRKLQNISDMDAEDIVGEVMLSVLNRAEASGPVDNPAAYVYRSLRNRMVDFQRGRSRTLSYHSFMDDAGEIQLIALLSDGASGVASHAERREFMRRLGSAISGLEPRQRAVFIATEMRGRSFKELSEQWQEPMGTLLSRKCRAVKALQRMLSVLGDEY